MTVFDSETRLSLANILRASGVFSDHNLHVMSGECGSKVPATNHIGNLMVCSYCRRATGNWCEPPSGVCDAPNYHGGSNFICHYCECMHGVCSHCARKDGPKRKACAHCGVKEGKISCSFCVNVFCCTGKCRQDGFRDHVSTCVGNRADVIGRFNCDHGHIGSL